MLPNSNSQANFRVEDKYDDDYNKKCCSKIINYLDSGKKNIDNIELFEDTGHTPINKIIKILVLGPGDSGKSTILKQMRIIHGKNYSIDERKKYKHLIIQNVIDSVVRLVDAMKLFSLNFENESNEICTNLILNCQQNLKSDLVDWNNNLNNYLIAIRSVWDDPSIKVCYKKRNLFYLNDSTEFFINNLTRICSSQYVPEIEDLLRVRQPTTAILEYKFKISDTYFLFVDVGGQRSERRKWINCFENVTSMLFVASLSDYDLYLSKEELRSSNSESSGNINRMRDALDLFRTLINWKKKNYVGIKRLKNEHDGKSEPVQTIQETLLFDKVSIILFLNKEDLFEEKFKHSSLKACFSDYVETDSAAKAKEFVARKFIACDMNSKNNQRDIYWHYTYALDRKNIETVVASVKDRILKYMLESMRL